MSIQYLVGLGIVAVLAIATWAPLTPATDAVNKKAVRQLSNNADGDFSTNPKQESKPRVGLWFAPTSAGEEGKF